MKVLLINGSSHKNGCTNRALEEIARTLSVEGVESEIVWTGNKITGCMAGWSCKKTGRCVIDDLVNEVAEKMKSSDGLIVGTPVYYASPNGTLLSFLDRLFFSSSAHMKFKPASMIASARRAGTTASLDVLSKYFSINQMPVVSSTYWNMVHGFTPEDVEKDLEGLQSMRNLARNMAWLLKSIEAGKKAGLELPASETGEHTNFIR